MAYWHFAYGNVISYKRPLVLIGLYDFPLLHRFSALCLTCVRQSAPTHFSRCPSFPCPRGCVVSRTTETGAFVFAGKAPGCQLCILGL